MCGKYIKCKKTNSLNKFKKSGVTFDKDKRKI